MAKAKPDKCWHCGAGELVPVFEDFVECKACGAVLQPPGQQNFFKKCPRCGCETYKPLFRESVECDSCGNVYQRAGAR